MKKYNVPNYVRYKKDVIACQPDEEIALEDLNERQLCYRFLPLTAYLNLLLILYLLTINSYCL